VTDWSFLLFFGAAVGAVGGFLAGAVGVGGGVVYAPAFHAIAPDAPMGVASSVSLVAIALTAAFSAYSHFRLGNVDLRCFFRLLPWLVFGAYFGLRAAFSLPASAVLLAMAALDLWIAWDLSQFQKKGSVSIPWLEPIALGVGFLSGMLGIAGGTMLVPLLRRSLSLRASVGTAAAAGWAMSLFALIVHGSLDADLWRAVPPSVQKTLAVTLVGLVVAAQAAARIGAWVHLRFEERLIRLSVSYFFIFLALFLGISAWLAKGG